MFIKANIYTMAKKKLQPTKELLMEKYSNHVLTHGKPPLNVYTFMNELGFDEPEFYKFFSDLEQLEAKFLQHFFEKAQQLVSQMQGYEGMPARERLLNLYFVFVENLTLNRSLVQYLLTDQWPQAMKRLHTLRPMHQQFVRGLSFDAMGLDLIPDEANNMAKTAKKVSDKAREALLWAHFVSVVEFWRKDKSESFESTDVYIEKSIDTGFELANVAPLQKMVDIGKFLWKERFQTTR